MRPLGEKVKQTCEADEAQLHAYPAQLYSRFDPPSCVFDRKYEAVFEEEAAYISMEIFMEIVNGRSEHPVAQDVPQIEVGDLD